MDQWQLFHSPPEIYFHVFFLLSISLILLHAILEFFAFVWKWYLRWLFLFLYMRIFISSWMYLSLLYQNISFRYNFFWYALLFFSDFIKYFKIYPQGLLINFNSRFDNVFIDTYLLITLKNLSWKTLYISLRFRVPEKSIKSMKSRSSAKNY